LGADAGDFVGAAMIDRLVHHAEVTASECDGQRRNDRDLGGPATPTTPTSSHDPTLWGHLRQRGQQSVAANKATQ
jgi:hypothetical protein